MNNLDCSTLYKSNSASFKGAFLLSPSTFTASNLYPFLTIAGGVSLSFILAIFLTVSPTGTFVKSTFNLTSTGLSLLDVGISSILTIFTV